MKQALAVALALATASAGAQDLPAFKLIRADEDWSALRDPALGAQAPAFKYLALGDEAYLSLGGEWRERVDAIDGARFGLGPRPDVYALQRLLLHADLHLGGHLRVFAQLGREDAIGKKPPLAPSDTDRGDVQNLFVDVTAGDHDAWRWRLGRQELQFNPTQRFVSVREGPNVRQSFDGLRGTWRDGALAIDVFATRPVAYREDAFDDKPDASQRFYGAYAAWRLRDNETLDAYWLGFDRDDASLGGSHGDERRRSLGLRWAARHRAWDYEVETVDQYGRFGGDAIRAWAVSALAGRTLAAPWSPRLGLELDAGSGGRSARTLDTFNPLFPKGAYFNEAALYSWANSLVLRPSVSLAPAPAVTLQLSVLQRWREDRHDAVYVQPYTPLPATLGNTARGVGTALQLDAAWRPTPALNLSLQLAHQNAGAAITRAGGHDVDFGMAMAQLRF